MSDLGKEHNINKEPLGNTIDSVSEVDPFASLNRLLEENPEHKCTYEAVISILSDDPGTEEGTEVECIEIDGYDYIIAKRIEIAGSTYLYLVNEDDVLDFMIQKVITEDGEEYITSLDSEKEFDLVQAYLQRDLFMRLKGKIQKDNEDVPEDH